MSIKPSFKVSLEYLKKNVTEMKSSKPGRAAAVLKRFAANPVDIDEENSFTLTKS